MRVRLAPARRRGVEILDDPRIPDALRHEAMRDVERSNRLFGGTRAMLAALRPILPSLAPRAVMLDVGTGMADIAGSAQREAREHGVEFTTVGLDTAESLLRIIRHRLSHAVAADALRLPFRDHCVDVVTCAQVLHHFTNEDARRLIAELHRVSRSRVVISDLRRSWLAAGGFWVASRLLRFSVVTSKDGVTSVLRGFTSGELRQLVADATGVVPLVRRGAFWRLTAVWSASG